MTKITKLMAGLLALTLVTGCVHDWDHRHHDRPCYDRNHDGECDRRRY